jgi:2-polyprenyl-6-hydroxyphenyl methylase / 3-demethylubiquinone-9 3-methyltransferase
VDGRELGKFSGLAEEWWNPHGKLGALHRLNPLRLAFIREASARHFARSLRALTPFSGLSLVDIGCGGGLLAEPLCRQGFDVLGIDAVQENIAAAAAHAGDTAAPPSYRCMTAEALEAEGRRADVVAAMEIVEHVGDRAAFLASCSELLKARGLMFLATINRTLKSLALAKIGAEYLLGWVPPGTHDWNKFVSPEQLSSELRELGLTVLDIQGVSFDPLAWQWRRSVDTSVNYMLAAVKSPAIPVARQKPGAVEVRV